MTVRERMAKYQEAKQLSDYAIEKALGKSKGYWHTCKNPTAGIITLFLETFPDLSAEWLMRGEGSMLRKQDIALMLDDAIKDSTFLDDRLDQMIEKKVNEAIQKHFNKEA